jgi:hypothetical protein
MGFVDAGDCHYSGQRREDEGFEYHENGKRCIWMNWTRQTC